MSKSPQIRQENRPRILFAEDDRLVIATLSQGLGKAGFDVTTATSGEMALELASSATFDLALLDIRMPGLCGIETAHLLLERFRLYTLFLTAYGERELVQRAVANGGLGYVMKPTDIGQLTSALTTALARAQDLKSLQEAKVQLECALASGRQTSMAIGILMERRGLSVEGAFEALRTSARKKRSKLEDISRDLVETLEDLNSMCGS